MPRPPKWTSYAIKVGALEIGRIIHFRELPNDPRALVNFRSALSNNRASMFAKIKVRKVRTGGVSVERVGTWDGKEEETVAADLPSPVFMDRQYCREKACPFPPGPSGLCRQHEFWSRQQTSPIGSGLSAASLEGA